jgi:S-phase kinase-associated protein 1
MAAPSEKKIKVTTSDGANLETDRDIAERSILIKNLLEDLGGDNDEAIPIPNVRLRACSSYQSPG